MQDQAPAKPSTEGPHHELTEDYERSDGQFFSVAVALAKAYCSQVAVHAARECVQLQAVSASPGSIPRTCI